MAEDSYNFNAQKPPRPVVGIDDAENSVIQRQDSARYLLRPDDDFARPYLAVAGTNRAYIWPLGVEGFEIQDTATLGQHRYIGDIDVDVDVIHKGVATIRMSGVFPGWTSVENMVALRDIFYADAPERGKILHLPGILPHLQYVKCDTFTYSHAEDERLMDIAYVASFVRQGVGPATPFVGPTQPSQIPGQVGRGTHKFKVNSKMNTLRKIAQLVYKSSARWADLYAVPKNSKWFTDHNIPSHQVPDKRLPLGLTIYY